MPDNETELPEVSFEEFMRDTPPPAVARVPDFFVRNVARQFTWIVNIADIWMRCTLGKCNGERAHQLLSADHCRRTPPGVRKRLFLVYVCRNCRQHRVEYALIFKSVEDREATAIVHKLGQWPPFEETPSAAAAKKGDAR